MNVYLIITFDDEQIENHNYFRDFGKNQTIF